MIQQFRQGVAIRSRGYRKGVSQALRHPGIVPFESRQPSLIDQSDGIRNPIPFEDSLQSLVGTYIGNGTVLVWEALKLPAHIGQLGLFELGGLHAPPNIVSPSFAMLM